MSSQRTNASAIISNKTIDKDGDDGGTGLGAGYIVLIVVGVLVSFLFLTVFTMKVNLTVSNIFLLFLESYFAVINILLPFLVNHLSFCCRYCWSCLESAFSLPSAEFGNGGGITASIVLNWRNIWPEICLQSNLQTLKGLSK